MASISRSIHEKFADLKQLDATLLNFENENVSLLNVPQSLQDYDAFLTRIHRLASTLGSHRNTSVPIHRLPVDILTRILAIVQDGTWERMMEDTVFRGLRYSYKATFRPWLKPFTAVCQHWRQITTTTKSFWQNICLSHHFSGPVELIRLFLARSSPLPFRVRWFHPIYSDQKNAREAALVAVKQEIHRLELFQVLGPLYHYPEFARNVFDIPTPNLHCLDLDVRLRPQQVENTVLDTVVAPALQRLRLGNATSVPPSLCPNLTHLCLSSAPQAMQFDKLLELLRSMPLLQHFIWEGVMPSPPLSSYHSLRPASLPRLKSLDLSALEYTHPDEWEMPFLLRHKLKIQKSDALEMRWHGIRPPATAHFNVDPGVGRVEFVLCEGVRGAFRLHLDTLSIPNMESMGVYGQHLGEIRAFAICNIPDNFAATYPQLASMPVEELHTGTSTITLDFFLELDMPEQPLFPKLTTLSVWHQSWRPNDVPPVFMGDGELVGLWEILLEAGQATRRRSNGSTYIVKLRAQPRYPAMAFTFNWMVEQCRSLRVKRGVFE